MNNIEGMRCHICGEIRPDNMLSVISTDISLENGLAIGTMRQNVRYCEDKPECFKKAQTYRLFQNKPRDISNKT